MMRWWIIFGGSASGVLILDNREAKLRKCRSTAEKLNKAFQAEYVPYDPQEDLGSYLERSGVMINMCLPSKTLNASGCDVAGDHVSASFVNSLLGWRIFPSGWGTILNMDHVSVLCSYPSDAATDFRDDRGCGPFLKDPDLGSEGFHNASPKDKFAIQIYVQEVYDRLGASDWTEAPCSETLLDVNGVPVSVNPNMTTIAWPDLDLHTFWYWINSYYEPFLGHPFCFDDAAPCVETAACANLLVYMGSDSWPPEQFADVLKQQVAMHAAFPDIMRKSFNEIVLDDGGRGSEATDLFRAAFWVNQSDSLGRTTFLRNAALVRANHIQGPLLVANLPWLEHDVVPPSLLGRDEERQYAPWPSSSSSSSDDDDLPGVVFSCDEERLLDDVPPDHE